MTFSGNGASSTIDLKYPNSNTVEENVAGNGSLGPFTFRDIRAAANTQQPSSSTCSGVFFPSVAGGGIISLSRWESVKGQSHGGGDCIDFVHGVGHCTLTFQILGGTGRFQGVSGGVLTYTETALPVLFDASGMNPVLTEVGEITGTISGIAMQMEPQDAQP